MLKWLARDEVEVLLGGMSYCDMYYCFWSALATTPASPSARTGAKEAIHFVEFVVCYCLSNHKSTTSRQPRKLKLVRAACVRCHGTNNVLSLSSLCRVPFLPEGVIVVL